MKISTIIIASIIILLTSCSEEPTKELGSDLSCQNTEQYYSYYVCDVGEQIALECEGGRPTRLMTVDGCRDGKYTPCFDKISVEDFECWNIEDEEERLICEEESKWDSRAYCVEEILEVYSPTNPR